MALVIAVAVVAASAGPVRLWTDSSSNGEDAAITEPTDDVERPEPSAVEQRLDGEWPSWIGTALQIIVVPLAVLVVMLVVVVAARNAPQLGRRRRWFRRAHGGRFDPLADVTEPPTLAVDIDAAHRALTSGTPANAIIACWMRLEADAGAGGLPRMAHETPAEYVERVVAAASVDPAPIGALAALYREARFSRHTLDDSHRESARTALRQVETALRHTVGASR